MTEQDRNFGARWFEEVWNRQNRNAIAEMVARDALIHEGGEAVRGPDGFYPFFDRMQETFSGLHVTVEDTFAQDDKLCIRWTVTMKHVGPGLGMPPTGKQLHTTGITIARVANGQAIEAWQNWDMLSLLQQIEGAQEKARTYMAGPR